MYMEPRELFAAMCGKDVKRLKAERDELKKLTAKLEKLIPELLK